MAMDLGDAEPSSMVASDMAPVLAMAGGGSAFVLHWVCADQLADEQSECVLRETLLEGLSGGNAVLITSAGDYVVGVDRASRSILSYAITPTDVVRKHGESIRDDIPARLLASLRDSNYVIGRDLDGDLVRLDPATLDAQRIAPRHEDMMLASVGEDHIVGRIVLDDENEELYLIPIDVPADDSDFAVPMEPILLSRHGIASRIVVTPRDEFVAVTYGEDDSAYTQVFRVPDGKKLQGFVGAMVSGRDEASELPGMRAVSPDGSQIAYRTEQGSLAMRSLLSHSSCLVHSSRAGSSTRLAGFSADGVLYFETDDGPGQSSINAWTPQRKERRRLSDPVDGYLLHAVPARPAEGDTPWALGVRQAAHVAVQSDREPVSLQLDDALVIPRDTTEIWAISAESIPGGRTIGLKRIQPRWSEQMRALAFDRNPSDAWFAAHDAAPDELVKLELEVSIERVCMSSGAPGSWAYSCGNANERNFLGAATTPSTETVDGNARDDAEVPATGDVFECGDGMPKYQSGGDCENLIGGCCFDDFVTACGWGNCGENCDKRPGSESVFEVYCTD